MAEDDQRKGIQSVEQAWPLLDAIVRSGAEQPLTVLAKQGAMSPSSAHRYLTSLIRIGLVRQNPVSGHYDLGQAAIRLGLAALSRFDFIDMADEALQGLTQRVGVDGHLTIWADYGPTIVRIRHAISPILTNLRLGRTLPLLPSASGQVFAAWLPPETTRSFLAAELVAGLGPCADEAALADLLQQVRKQGIASIDGSVIPGLRAIAAPVRDPQGSLLAVIALVSSDRRLIDGDNDFKRDLVETAMATSRALGWDGLV